MPVYTYRCDACDVEKDVLKGLEDRSEVPCPDCKVSMRRIFQSVPFIFKQDGTGARKNG